MRLLSYSATIVTAMMIFLLSRKISNNLSIAFCAAILFLAGYHTTGGWDDLARVDALYMMLTVAGVALVVYGNENCFQLALAGSVSRWLFLPNRMGTSSRL